MQAICRLVPRLRPTGQGSPAAGAGAPVPSPTEFVDGVWRVIGTGRDMALGAPARLSRRMAQGATPLAATAAVTGGSILVCRGAGWPNSAPQRPEIQAIADLPAQGDQLGLIISGPSIFRLDSPYLDRVEVIGELRAPLDPALVAVPEPASIVLFASFLVLFSMVLLAAGRRRAPALTAAARRPRA
jgi:hypothetical protein